MKYLMSVCAVALVMGAPAVMANNYEEGAGQAYMDEARSFVDELDITVGAGGIWSPEYEGSNDQEFQVLPYFDIRYKDFAQLNIDGLNFTFLRDDHFKAGAGLGFDFGRDDNEASILRGLGDVDGTIEGRVFAGYEWGAMDANIAAAQDLIDGHGGFTVEGDVGYRFIFRDTGTFVRPSVGVNYASEDYMQSYFGVDTGQSARSGLATYNADGGIKDVNAGVFASQRLSSNLSLIGLARYSRLQDEPADSPITESNNQFTTGVFAVYKF